MALIMLMVETSIFISREVHCTTPHGMSNFTSHLMTTSQQSRLNINKQKRKVLKVHPQKMCNASGISFTINNNQLEFVNNFQYLGAKMMRLEVRRSMFKIGSIKPLQHSTDSVNSGLWRSKSIKRHIKLGLFSSSVMSVSLYGRETWKMTMDDQRKLRCLKLENGVAWGQL